MVLQQGEDIKRIPPGIHGVSNHLLDTPWPKVERGKRGMTRTLTQSGLKQALFHLLADQRIAEDHLLPDTGVGLDMERMLSPIFITSPDYGTRSSTLLFVDYQGRVTVIERTHYPGSKRPSDAKYQFTI